MQDQNPQTFPKIAYKKSNFQNSKKETDPINKFFFPPLAFG